MPFCQRSGVDRDNLSCYVARMSERIGGWRLFDIQPYYVKVGDERIQLNHLDPGEVYQLIRMLRVSRPVVESTP